MSTSTTRTWSGLGLVAALAAFASPAMAQPSQRGGMQSWNGASPPFAQNWQGWAPGTLPGAFGFGMASVSLTANNSGGVSINIANLGSSASYFGGGWRGGYMPWAGFSAIGMNAFAMSVGGGGGAPGGVSIGIANVAMFSGFAGNWAPHGGWHGPRFKPRGQQSNEGGDSGDADSGGGDSSSAN